MEKTEKGEKVDLKPLIKMMKSLPAQVADRIEIPEVEFPEQEKVDLSPVLTAINDNAQKILKAVAELKIPEYSKQFKALAEIVSQISSRLDRAKIEEAIKLLPELNKELAKVPALMEQFRDAEKKLQDTLLISRALMGGEGKKPEKSPLTGGNRILQSIMKS